MKRTAAAPAAVVLLAWGLLAAGIVPAGAAPDDAERTVGTIQSVAADGITLTTRSGGQVKVKTTAETRITNRVAAKLEEIKRDDFVAVTAKKEADGSLVAVSINIFPPQLKGQIREGQWPMESGNIMTNAIVTQYVSRVEGRTLHLKHKEGTATIKVPKETEIHRIVLIKVADLKPGMSVFVRGTRGADGTVVAATISVTPAQARQ
ncbi:MAG: hypothetical protein HY660_17335 [Armatimonadetes bacterium]|nr:hypothetical protein [Armatimonadota bacterium]